jgi:hypothetical protein
MEKQAVILATLASKRKKSFLIEKGEGSEAVEA